MSPVEATQVCRLFQNLNENKTSLDIPNEFSKIASEALSIPFTCEINISNNNKKIPKGGSFYKQLMFDSNRLVIFKIF